MTPKRVLHITDSSAMGGAEQQILTTMRLLDRSQWEPVLVHQGHAGIRPLIDAVREAGMTEWRMPQMSDGVGGALHVPAFTRALRAQQPMIAHIHLTWPLAMKWPLASALAARVPAVVASVHSAVPCHTNRWVLWQQRLLSARIDRYLAVSSSVAERCAEWFGWPPGRFTVITNGIEVDAVSGGTRWAGRTQLGVPEDVPLVLALARLDPVKGLDTLVRAAVDVPDAIFVLAGDGPERATLTDQIAAAGLTDRVRLPGHIADTPNLLAACDLLVLPSRSEGLPLSLLEAMAAGVPIVATDIPGIAAVIDSGRTGMLVPVDDAEALAATISAALADSEMRHRLADAARIEVREHYRAQVMVDQIEQLYAAVLETGSR